MHQEGTTVETISQQAARLRSEWDTNPRWNDTERTYSAQDVVRLRGSVTEEFTLARRGAERLRKLLAEEDAVAALGALTGNQAVQQVKAGLRAIYLSGWQVAADANLAGQTYPDQSLYPVNSVPQVVRRINNALLRADQIAWSESEDGETAGAPYWLAPIVADAEAGFGGVLNAFELMKAMIAAGAAGVHWEDQLASEKKCGHLGGKVLIPTGQHIRTLNAARLAADVAGVPTIVIARTDSLAATLLTSDHDERDRPFVTGTRTAEGFYEVQNGIEPVIARGLAYAPYAQIAWSESGDGDTTGSPYWLAPIVSDAEAGFGGVLNAFELMKAMIAAGAAGVHWEDQLASEKKCGHLGGKVLIPTGQHIKTLNAARLAADVCDVPTLIIARTDAQAATLLTADVDERDQPFVTGERTAEGFYRVRNGIEPCIARGLAYAPYSDLLWMETSKPDLDVARAFAEGIKSVYPDQMLAFNCSPSFNWRAHLDEETIAKFGKELAAMGYRFQFITLAGFHALNHSMFDLAKGFATEGMPAYVRLQQAEFEAEKSGYTATRHQREVGTGYFDRVTSAISPNAETVALSGSTEAEQFHAA